MDPLHYRPRTSFNDVRQPEIEEWESWIIRPELRLWEAVALSCDVEPSSLPAEGVWKVAPTGTPARRFYLRYEAALSAVNAGVLQAKRPTQYPSDWTVNASDFSSWARQAGVMLPLALNWRDLKTAAVNESSSSGRWPWGDYETRLLRWVDFAVRRFWVNYDPSDPSTAPKAEDVVPWLLAHQKEMGEKLSDREAKLITQLVKADTVRSGPR